MDSINVGIIGLGTVGTGVYKLLERNAGLIEKKVGAPVRVTRVADLDVEREREVMPPREIMTTDADEVIRDPDVHIVVELIGGTTTAGDIILKAAEAGKPVVTANKALLAERGGEIIPRLEKAGVEIGFEASVGGGIPILKSLKESLAGNRIKEIFGIINGTSNYILSRMSSHGEDFNTVLRDAQKIGLAEADPTLDVDGIDSAHKLAILIWLATGATPDFEKIYVEGIRDITPLDIEFAKEFGYEVKLLAIAKMGEGEVEARVHPTMVPRDHLLATVRDAFNAIYVTGDFSG
ncbi:MAG: homoserine dehydrogenase, partial [Deltaproteobacteria bacterium]